MSNKLFMVVIDKFNKYCYYVCIFHGSAAALRKTFFVMQADCERSSSVSNETRPEDSKKIDLNQAKELNPESFERIRGYGGEKLTEWATFAKEIFDGKR